MCGRHSLQIVKHRARFCRASVDERGTSALYDGDDAGGVDPFLIPRPGRLSVTHGPAVSIIAGLSDSLSDDGKPVLDNLARAYLLPPPHEAKSCDDDREKGDRNAANH
jgi:hypothetical protein